MSQRVSGQVYRVFAKEFPPKKGKPATTWYSIKLEDDKVYYRCKSHNPGDIAGKTVSFEIDEVDGDSANVDTATIKVVEAPKAASGSSGPALSGGARDASIQYQSSRKDAIEMVKMLVTSGAIKLPAKEAGREEAITALVDSYTAQYFADIPTLGAVARANGVAGEGEEEQKDVGPADEE